MKYLQVPGTCGTRPNQAPEISKFAKLLGGLTLFLIIVNLPLLSAFTLTLDLKLEIQITHSNVTVLSKQLPR